ncbi:MAG: nonstructural protein [Microvirus sp.]|nr:MAG: nonstructural protein [Microvirus sp.]
MEHCLYSVYDSKAEAYLPVMMLRSNGEAIRAFESAIRDNSHPFGKNPADFSLMHIGYFDDVKGTIRANSALISMGNGLEFLDHA